MIEKRESGVITYTKLLRFDKYYAKKKKKKPTIAKHIIDKQIQFIKCGKNYLFIYDMRLFYTEKKKKNAIRRLPSRTQIVIIFNKP